MGCLSSKEKPGRPDRRPPAAQHGRDRVVTDPRGRGGHRGQPGPQLHPAALQPPGYRSRPHQGGQPGLHPARQDTRRPDYQHTQQQQQQQSWAEPGPPRHSRPEPRPATRPEGRAGKPESQQGRVGREDGEVGLGRRGQFDRASQLRRSKKRKKSKDSSLVVESPAARPAPGPADTGGGAARPGGAVRGGQGGRPEYQTKYGNLI